jgi:hypothetical protein
MSNFGYERTLMGYLENLRTYIVTRPMTLGGVAGPGGGTGGPTGGFIGTLPQSRISYDTTEASTLSTPLSGYSLVDNLNHVRGRLSGLEALITASGISISSVPVYTNNAMAISSGLVAGNLYRLGGDPDYLCIVH